MVRPFTTLGMRNTSFEVRIGPATYQMSDTGKSLNYSVFICEKGVRSVLWVRI